jgi:amino acid adenylation domain-containing protein
VEARDDRCVHELIADQAARAPGAVAIEFGGSSVSYGELERRANRLARRLRGLGVGPDVLVGIFLERSPEMVVALLGVLKAGGAYVPLDPTYPRSRIAFMLADCSAPVLVTHSGLRDRLPENSARLLCVDRDRAPIAPRRSAAPQRLSRDDDLAYVIYTSGSTGKPKGVMIEHGALASFLRAMRAEPGLGPHDRLLAVTTLSFDIAALELFLPLVVGGCIRLASAEVARDGARLEGELEGVTVMQATPATWRMLIDAGWAGSAELTAICGGEALTPSLAHQLLARCRRLWNLYGPTEATVWCTRELVSSSEPPISIGRPLEGTDCQILDADQRELGPGAVGELHVGGAQLARGYLNRPQLTAERFIPNPLATGRLYKTGDLARRLPDGRIECLGRLDHQVKINGHRIELGEVEAALEQERWVRSAVVVAHGDATGERKLAAYVVLAPNHSPTATELRRKMLDRLPAYMVPSRIALVDHFPLTPNGKVDRAALPEPGLEGAGSESPYVAPRDELETKLVASWEDELGIRPIGVRDDFFSLGVTSLATARLFARVEREFGAELPRASLFHARTVAGLADLMRERSSAPAWCSLVPLQPHGDQPPVFIVHGGAGTILLAHPLARRLGVDQPLYGFQARGLFGRDGVLRDVEAMAAQYISEMREVQSVGPYRVTGYCFGGIVAFEMAQQLLRAGEQVALLAMVNAPSPGYIREHEPTFRGVDDEDDVPTAPPPPRQPSLRTRLRRKVALRSRLRARIERYRVARGHPLPDERRNSFFLGLHHFAERRYEPAPYPGELLLFCGQNLYRDPRLGWDRVVAGRIEVVEVPGATHRPREAMDEPYVGVIAERLLAPPERAPVRKSSQAA